MNKEELNRIMCQADDRLDAMKDKLVFQSEEIERLKIDYQQANDIIVEQSKEIERLKKELNKYKYRPSNKINFDKLMNSRKEVERLNNIINELEKYILEEIDDAQEELNIILQGNDLDYKNECTKEFNCIKKALDMLLDKLQELKGVDKSA